MKVVEVLYENKRRNQECGGEKSSVNC